MVPGYEYIYAERENEDTFSEVIKYLADLSENNNWERGLNQPKRKYVRMKSMGERKERITENGIDYILIGDYYIPDLKLPKKKQSILIGRKADFAERAGIGL